MTTGETVSVSNASDTIGTRIADSDGLLVGLDFDGTLAPIAPTPDRPTITPRNRRAIVRLLARPTVRVAVVSGRALEDLQPRVGLDGITYAGNHGLELNDGEATHVHSGAKAARPALERVITTMSATLDGLPGWEIEDKRLTATLHYRHVPESDRPGVEAAVARIAAEFEAVELASGKESVEFRPAVDWDKGDAIRTLATHQPDSWRTMYVGDDTTDEDAFRALDTDDIAVFVGEAETTAAYRLPTQRCVAPFLEWVASMVPHGNQTVADSRFADGGPTLRGTDQ